MAGALVDIEMFLKHVSKVEGDVDGHHIRGLDSKVCRFVKTKQSENLASDHRVWNVPIQINE